jgi:hypothetical protein
MILYPYHPGSGRSHTRFFSERRKGSGRLCGLGCNRVLVSADRRRRRPVPMRSRQPDRNSPTRGRIRAIPARRASECYRLSSRYNAKDPRWHVGLVVAFGLGLVSGGVPHGGRLSAVLTQARHARPDLLRSQRPHTPATGPWLPVPPEPLDSGHGTAHRRDPALDSHSTDPADGSGPPLPPGGSTGSRSTGALRGIKR